MRDSKGNLLITDNAINEEVYTKRLENNPMKDGLEAIEEEHEKLAKIVMEEAKKNKTPPWTMADYDKAVKHLKNNKSRDPLNYANEI